MEFSSETLKSTAKAVREALSTVAIPVKSVAARQLWAHTLAGHQKFEALVEKAKQDGTVSLTPDPERMIEWGKHRKKEISFYIASYAIHKALSDLAGESYLNLPMFDGNTAPAYHSNGSEPFTAFIAMNERGEVYLDYGEQTNVDYATGRTLCWDIDPRLSGYELNILLNEIQPLLEHVHAGHTIEWDGRNHVGRLTDTAQVASNSIDELCRAEQPSNIVMTAYNYYYDMESASEVWPDGMTLDEVIAETELSQDDSLILLGDLRAAVVRGAKEEFDGSETPLPEHILAGLVEEGAISSDELKAYRKEFNLEPS